MLKIGIVGDDSALTTAKILGDIYAKRGRRAFFNYEHNNVIPNDTDILLEPFCVAKNTDRLLLENSFDILIIVHLNVTILQNILFGNGHPDIIILNSDEKNILGALRNCSSKIITFGFNNKSCITASSITEDFALFCIQRSILTFSGKTILEQEFSIKLPKECQNIHSVLGAVTAALIDDADIQTISDLYAF